MASFSFHVEGFPLTSTSGHTTDTSNHYAKAILLPLGAELFDRLPLVSTTTFPFWWVYELILKSILSASHVTWIKLHTLPATTN